MHGLIEDIDDKDCRRPSSAMNPLPRPIYATVATTDDVCLDVRTTPLRTVVRLFYGLECPLWVVSGQSEARKLPDGRIWGKDAFVSVRFTPESGHSKGQRWRPHP